MHEWNAWVSFFSRLLVFLQQSFLLCPRGRFTASAGESGAKIQEGRRKEEGGQGVGPWEEEHTMDKMMTNKLDCPYPPPLVVYCV